MQLCFFFHRKIFQSVVQVDLQQLYASWIGNKAEDVNGDTEMECAVDVVNNVSAVDVMSSSAAASLASDLWVAVETWMEVRLGCGCLKHVVSLTAVHVAEGRVACCLQAVDTERHEHQPQHPQWHVSTRGGAVRQDGRGQAAAGREYTQTRTLEQKHSHTHESDSIGSWPTFLTVDLWPSQCHFVLCHPVDI